jgi:heptosyltransferase-2
MSGKSPKKILVLRFSSIGDIVLTFPVVAALKAAYPDCQIDYVTKPAFRHLLEACPGLSHIFTLESSIRQLRKDINFQSYDAVLDLHNNLRTLLLTAFSGVKVYKYPKNNWNKWLLTRFKIKQERRQHVVERYLSTLKQAFGLEVLAPENPYEIPESEQFSIQDATGFTPRKYVAFAIGAQFATKRLPTDLMIKLLQKMEHPLVLLGGKEDQQTANEIVAALGGQKVVSMVGQLNIHGSAWLVKNAAALLTHDTGLMHIGACFEVPIHLIWGNTVKDFGMYPFRLEQENCFQYEVENLKCRPCSKIGFQNCPKGHFACMRQQDLDFISTQLNQTKI